VSFAPVHRAERLDPEGRLDTMRMAAELNAAGRTANAYSCHKTLLDGIKGIVAANAGGLVVFFSNGSFDGIQHKTVALLRESRTEPHSLSN
jgi:UDP-N-acetylmuramate-alanine ligase